MEFRLYDDEDIGSVLILKVTKCIWISTAKYFNLIPHIEGKQYPFIFSIFWLWFGFSIMEKRK